MDTTNKQPSKTDPPVYHVPGEYPKHLYKSKQIFADGEAIKHALTSRLIIQKLVGSKEEEDRYLKAGWTADLGDFVEDVPDVETDEFGDPIPIEDPDEVPAEEESEESVEEGIDEDSPTPRRRKKRK